MWHQMQRVLKTVFVMSVIKQMVGIIEMACDQGYGWCAVHYRHKLLKETT